MASKLTHLVIDRVDGVDDPATGKRFLMAKASDVDEVLESLTALQKGVHSMVEAFQKEGIVFSREAGERIAAVAKMCEVVYAVKGAEDPAAVPAPVAAAAAAAAPAAAVTPAVAVAQTPNEVLMAAMMKMSEGIGAICKGINDMPQRIVAGIAKTLDAEPDSSVAADDDEPLPSSQPSPSASAIRKGREKEFGKGLFEAVIYPSRRGAAVQ